MWHRIDRREVVLPNAARNLVAAHVERREFDVAQLHLMCANLLGRWVDREAALAEHAHERALAGVIEAQDEHLGILVRQSERAEDVLHEEIVDPHSSRERASSERVQAAQGAR